MWNLDISVVPAKGSYMTKLEIGGSNTGLY